MVRINPPEKSKYPWYMRWIFRMQEKREGEVLLSTKIWGLSPKLYLAFAAFWKTLDRKSSPLDRELRSLIQVAVSELNRCSFCVKLSHGTFAKSGGRKEKIEALARFSESALFTEQEKCALRYALAVANQTVDDALFTNIRKHFTETQVIEITALASFQTLSNRFNTALRIE